MKFKLILVMTMLSTSVFANETGFLMSNAEVREEIRELKREIYYLKQRVSELEGKSRPSSTKKWGCYLDDITAGGVYGTGNTQAEAKGKVLEKCNDKGGVCFEMSVECNKS